MIVLTSLSALLVWLTLSSNASIGPYALLVSALAAFVWAVGWARRGQFEAMGWCCLVGILLVSAAMANSGVLKRLIMWLVISE